MRYFRDSFWPWLFVTLIAIGAWMAYVYHGGEQSHIRIHDCLDSNLPTYSVFAQSEVFFSWSDAVFQPLLGGIPPAACRARPTFTFSPIGS